MADKNYFRLTSLEDGNEVAIVKNGTPADVTLEYSVDDGSTWTAYTIGTGISLNTNNFVLFRGDNSTFSQSTSNYYNVTATKTFNASGNIMSLLDKSCLLISIDGKSNVFCLMFYQNVNLIDVSDIELPAQTLATYCYLNMFSGCTSLTSAPSILPAMTLARDCYSSMFSNCTSLTSAPALPATTIVSDCYNSMFSGCTSLTSAPALPATIIVNKASSCYSSMFNGCTSLTQAPALPAQTLALGCYDSMFQGCTSLTQAPALPAQTLADFCYIRMFQDCTSLTSAPELPATTLASLCYYRMFYGCTSLTSAPELPATTLVYNCYNGMFFGCSNLTSAPSILPATTLVDSCYSLMFQNCTSLTTAPELPATTLASNCYSYMFQGCTSLNKIEVSFTEWLGSSINSATFSWLQNVSSTGTFICPEELPETRGSSNIPSGWTIEHPSAAIYIKKFYIDGKSVKTLFLDGKEIFVEEFDQPIDPPIQQFKGLKLTALEPNCTVSLSSGTNAPTVNLEYSTDNGISWNTWDKSAIVLNNENDSVCIRADENGNQYFSQIINNNDLRFNKFNTTGKLKVSGNPISLVDQTCQLSNLTGKDGLFMSLFNGTTIVDCSEFDISSLDYIPNWCFNGIFSNCTQLTNIFDGLPAKNIVKSDKSFGWDGYGLLFCNCTALTDASNFDLPLSSFNSYVGGGYGRMFKDCTSLSAGPKVLPAENLSNSDYAYYLMFENCNSLVKAPYIKAKTLDGSYIISEMFKNCTNLNSISVDITSWPNRLFASTSWVQGVPSTGTFYCPTALGTNDTITRGNNNCPSGWTVINTDAT